MATNTVLAIGLLDSTKFNLDGLVDNFTPSMGEHFNYNTIDRKSGAELHRACQAKSFGIVFPNYSAKRNPDLNAEQLAYQVGINMVLSYKPKAILALKIDPGFRVQHMVDVRDIAAKRKGSKLKLEVQYYGPPRFLFPWGLPGMGLPFILEFWQWKQKRQKDKTVTRVKETRYSVVWPTKLKNTESMTEANSLLHRWRFNCPHNRTREYQNRFLPNKFQAIKWLEFCIEAQCFQRRKAMPTTLQANMEELDQALAALKKQGSRTK